MRTKEAGDERAASVMFPFSVQPPSFFLSFCARAPAVAGSSKGIGAQTDERERGERKAGRRATCAR